jgi:NAD(P)H-hydrate epimerase
MITVTAKQMKKLDERAIMKFGIPALCLMENAGRAVADEAWAMLGKSRKAKVLILCGAGNNGGDGFVAARHLLNKGLKPVVLFSGDVLRMKEPAAVNLEALRRLKIRLLKATAGVLTSLARYDLIIDAFYGIGLSSDLQGLCRRVVEAVNASGVPVLAVDIPSGLDATTGKVRGVSVKAKRTVTFACAKKGLLSADGPRHSGKVVVHDIGIPVQR